MTRDVHHEISRTRSRPLSAALTLVVALFFAQQMVQGQSFTTLYTFTGGTDGAFPEGLTLDSSGNLYGLASAGGDPSCFSGYGCGTVFKLDATGQFTILHAFTGTPDGATPSSFSALVRDARGNLYGTTQAGGAADGGTVFRVDPTGREKVLHSFNHADGFDPSGGVVRDAAGNLYGTTDFGGDANCNGGSGCGVVFKLDRTGKKTVLHRFTGTPDGQEPLSRLGPYAAGNLYGTTGFGGAQCANPDGCGTIFKLDATGQETILYAFTGGADGGVPYAGLVRDAAGNLYGTTVGFGTYDNGVVFKLDPYGSQTVLYSFTGGADGGTPIAGLTWGPGGSLYGTTIYGGDPDCGCGIVFKLDPQGHQTVLHTFTQGADGAYPFSLVRDSAGNLFGTTSEGGNLSCNIGYGCGTVFKLTP